MGYKKRGYDKDSLSDRPRDYKLFAIACEGAVTERNYFRLFSEISHRIKVDIIPEESTDPSGDQHEVSIHNSSPKWVLNRAAEYVDKLGLANGDEIWLVLDVDRWKSEDLQSIIAECGKKGWNVAISNPCFEVWLCYHKYVSLEEVNAKTSQEFKTTLSKTTPGGYNPYKFISSIQEAIIRAKAKDSNTVSMFPSFGETKVYLLAEALLKKIGITDFNKYIESVLPIKMKAFAEKYKK